jgi:Ferritin-like domain
VVSGTGPPGVDRRALLRGAGGAALGAGALTGLSGCGGNRASGSPTQIGSTAVHVDLQILTSALELERRTVSAYIAAIPLLPHSLVKGAKAFLSEELAHTGELISLIKGAGAKAPDRADSYDLGPPPRTPQEVVGVLHGFERLQIASYLSWIPRLSPGPLRAAVATILASDAQHLAVLRTALGEPALASAFVTGNE